MKTSIAILRKRQVRSAALRRAVRGLFSLAALGALPLLDTASAQIVGQPPPEPPVLPITRGLGTLKQVSLPPIPGLEKFVADSNALVRLGKAMFWDQNVGSDGASCGTCHFH